jgi:hypothetical protein
MFRLGQLRIVRREKGDPFAFVGMRVSPVDRVAELWLPQGFQGFPDQDYPATVRVFFSLYRVMRTYAKRFGLRNDLANKKDPFEIGAEGVDFSTNSDDSAVLSFAKLNLIEKVFDNFDELVLSSILTKQVTRPPQTYEQIHRFLHRATYLEADVIYLDNVPGDRAEFHTFVTELVGLFCYIYVQLNSWLRDVESIPDLVLVNANNFAERYLPVNSGLFVEDTFELTMALLKDALTSIDRNTSYKDDDYWQLYDAVELFLHGQVDLTSQNGIVWGISDYHPVWEDMCHDYFQQVTIPQLNGTVLYADSPRLANTVVGGRQVYSAFADMNPFTLSLKQQVRYMRPDLVYYDERDQNWYRRDLDSQLDIRTTSGTRNILREIVIKARSDEGLGILSRLREQLAKRGHNNPHRPNKSTLVYHSIPSPLLNAAFDEIARDKARREVRSVYLIDFKYHNFSDFFRAKISEKMQNDLLKQQVYEVALQRYLAGHFPTPVRILNQIAVPCYVPADDSTIFLKLPDSSIESLHGTNFNDFVSRSGVQVWAVNFMALAAVYGANS